MGRQFDNTSSLPAFKAYHNACRQTMRIAQFSIGNLGIDIRHTDLHCLTGKIPRAIGLDTCGKSAQEQCPHSQNYKYDPILHDYSLFIICYSCVLSVASEQSSSALARRAQ